ncbi:hypothetical protein BH23PLA1_BH23PLA1_30480 [soil metagenome]
MTFLRAVRPTWKAPNPMLQPLQERAESPRPEPPFRPPGWTWEQSGEVGWWVRPPWRSALLGPSGLRLDEWRRSGRLKTVKQGPQRIVYRADLPEGTVYVKHFLVPGWREKLRQWFRRGKGRNEARRAVWLSALGVPTITPIALGERRQRRFLFENYLISPEIPDTIPLDRFVEQVLPMMNAERAARLRIRLARSLADLTARLHQAGLVHADFHPGNVLVRLDEQDQPHLAMIDLDALRFRGRLGPRRTRENLALLNHYFWIRSARSDRLRFLLAYLSARGEAPGDVRKFARQIERSTRTWAERLWRRWGRRCLGTNKYFRVYRGFHAWSVASRDLDPTTVATLLADPDAPLQWPEARLLKQSRTTTVVELELPVEGRPSPVIYKRFNRKKWLEPIWTAFRPSRAWRAWRAGQHLLCRGIPTPRNLAVIGRTGRTDRGLSLWLTPTVTYLITIQAQPSITLGDYLAKILPTRDPSARRAAIRRLTRALARLIRTMHERSISDRDLKSSNILIEGDPESVEPRLSLIDLVGVTLSHPLPMDRRLQNLARLQVSLAHLPEWTRTDSLRFLRTYLPWAFVARKDWKAIWRDIDGRSRIKAERNRRRGRILS